MKDLNIIRAIVALDSGDSTYVNGDLNEIRTLCDDIGTFYVIPVTGDQCKVTKAKSSTVSFYANLVLRLNDYKGTPITLKEDVQKVRMSVSRFNKLNGRTFSVRSVDASTAEVFSTNLTDYASITLEMFQDEVARYTEKLRKLRELVANADENALKGAELGMTQTITADYEEEDEDDNNDAHDPSIFVTRPHFAPEPEPSPEPIYIGWHIRDCAQCNEELHTQNPKQFVCDACQGINDEEDIV